MNIGYIRVSDKSQNPDRQIEKMKAIGIEERFIFVDRQSGKDFSRPAYQSMKRVLRAGDLLYLDALDRLGRDYDGIIDEWKDMTRNIVLILSCWSRNHCLTAASFARWGNWEN